jgi:hypothetical protein
VDGEHRNLPVRNSHKAIEVRTSYWSDGTNSLRHAGTQVVGKHATGALASCENASAINALMIFKPIEDRFDKG